MNVRSSIIVLYNGEGNCETKMRKWLRFSAFSQEVVAVKYLPGKCIGIVLECFMVGITTAFVTGRHKLINRGVFVYLILDSLI